MKKNKIGIYTIDIIVLIITITMVCLFKTSSLANNVNTALWTALAIGCFAYFGKPKNTNYFKKVITRYTLICCLAYLLVTYLSGLFLGFNTTVFNLSIKSIILNTYKPILLLFSQAFVRFFYCEKVGNNKKPIIIFTILASINVILSNALFYSFYDNEAIFVFVCLYTLPVIAQQALYTYLSYNVSFVPCLMLGFVIDIISYMVPIFPNLGNYLSSVMYLAFPFFVYIVSSRILKYHDKKKLSFKRFTIGVTTIPLLIFAGILVILISGVFKYKMVAIASNSMNPEYYRGDAVIYEQTGFENVKVGDVAVFYSNNKIVTHRVIKKYYENGKNYIITKGDNNTSDDGATEEKDVYGKVNYIVKYIGFPTLWFSELFRK